MPDRWERTVNPRDLTGLRGKELHRKAKIETDKQLAKQRADIARQVAEIDAVKASMPVAYENFDETDYIDYTEEGGYHGVPNNEYDPNAGR